MRELKFRRWDEGSTSLNDVHEFILPVSEGAWTSSFTFYKGDRLQQSTGLKDKNGVEIYEGDIITIDVSQISHVKTVDKYEVLWNDDTTLGYGWGAWGLNGEGFTPLHGFGVYEVIGNMYEEKDENT